jgi:hypothetical protein
MPSLKECQVVREFYGDEEGTLFCLKKIDQRFKQELIRLGYTILVAKWVIQKDGFAGKGGPKAWVEVEATIPYSEAVKIFTT